MDVVLGLDLGTTNAKVLAIGEDGQPVASAAEPTPVRTVAADQGQVHLEYDAEALWTVSARLIRQVVDALKPQQRVVCLAVASMGESGVLVDTDGHPLAPIITWHDTRPAHWVDWWSQRLSETETFAITGLTQRHIFSVYKLMWYREQSPAVFARARSWLCLADWITFCLTGQRTTSYCMASRTMLFDVRRRTWSEGLCRMTDLPLSLLPPALPSGQVAGTVTADAARMTGLLEGTPIVTGGHDHICAALAAGVIAPGGVMDSSGTAEALFVSLNAPRLDERAALSGFACGCHTARDRYYLLGGIMGGAVVNWLCRLLAGDDSPATVSRLMQEAESSPPGANGVWFGPYLDGSGPPVRDPDAWGAWLGLRLGHTRADVIRSTMEGLTFGIRYVLEGVRQVADAAADLGAHDPGAQILRVVGGGSRNTWWQQLKADVLGMPIETPAVSDVTAQGAALLAGLGVGLFADEEDAASRAYRPAARYEVNPAAHARYDAAYRDVFGALYPTLRTISLHQS